jgi:peroxiredoxin-like protein
MKNPIFSYSAEIEWDRARAGDLRVPGLPPLKVAALPEFNGPGGAWSPEALYVGAVASCFMLTFLAYAERGALELASADVSAEGKLERAEEGYRFTEVTLKPTVVVRRADDVERAERLVKKAEGSCFIAASIKSRVVVMPRVYHRQTAVYPCPAIQADSNHMIV